MKAKDQEKQLLESLEYTASVLIDLHDVWTPHEAQILPGRALFYEGKEFVFLECGRKYGKTDFVIYCLYRAALTTPAAACYFIAPFLKQAKELIWANNRLQFFLTENMRKKYRISINNSEMRIKFGFNGSFIKLDGSDNYVAYDGINPHFIAYDEFKDHHPKFHERMEPNLATYTAPLLVIGTPPENDDNHFIKLADSIRGDPDGAWFNFPSETNPHISKKWLDKTKARLVARGELDVWMREYMAKRVKGGKNALYPMFEKKKHVLPLEDIKKDLSRQSKTLDWYCTADPASSSVFGVLFTAINRYTRMVYHVDELYISDTRETSTRKMWKQIYKKLLKWNPGIDEWNYTYDEAAKWFQLELLDITEMEFGQGNGIFFDKTEKSKNKKEDGISLIKDQMLFGFWICSEDCENLQFEVLNYIKDRNGKIPKENDHLLDCMRYTNASDYYSHVPSDAPKDNRDEEEKPRFATLQDDRLNYQEKGDWTVKVLGDDYNE